MILYTKYNDEVVCVKIAYPLILSISKEKYHSLPKQIDGIDTSIFMVYDKDEKYVQHIYFLDETEYDWYEIDFSQTKYSVVNYFIKESYGLYSEKQEITSEDLVGTTMTITFTKELIDALEQFVGYKINSREELFSLFCNLYPTIISQKEK